MRASPPVNIERERSCPRASVTSAAQRLSPGSRSISQATGMKRQDELSFAEFECQFTGEDPAKKLERVRGEQDAAYNCLEKKAEQG